MAVSENLNAMEYLEKAVSEAASDLMVIAGAPLSIKKDGEIRPMPGAEGTVTPENAAAFVTSLYEMAKRKLPGDMDSAGFQQDFSMSLPGLARFRVNVYKQRNSISAVVRIVGFGIPDWRELHIPEGVVNLHGIRRGLVLVAGPAGSGKSTTLACMIDRINHERSGHVITIEDPIEFLHKNDKCVFSQRELGTDVDNYKDALRASLRQAPNVIMIGELRDSDTMQMALSAAESGHLVISTLHSLGAADTIEYFADAISSSAEGDPRAQLARVLKMVVSQQLLPSVDGGLYPVFEVMSVNPDVKEAIRTNDQTMFVTMMQEAMKKGTDMITMDNALLELYKEDVISEDTAITHALFPELLKPRL